MYQINLGKSNLKVSRIGFGCMGMSGTYEAHRKDDESKITIQKSFAMGINFFDTIYGEGHSELFLGKALALPLKTNREVSLINSENKRLFTGDYEWRKIIF